MKMEEENGYKINIKIKNNINNNNETNNFWK